MLRGRYFWKEAWRRKDCSTLAGRTTVQAKPATKRQAQKSTDSTIVQNGTKYDAGDSRSLQKVGAESENLKEGVEVAKGYYYDASSQ